MTKKNVIGEKYNMLTIVSDAPSRREPSGRLLKIVNTVCDCGSEKQNISYKELKRGRLKSCGCLSKSIKIEVNIGDKFGHWEILEENPYNKDKDGRNFTCQCVCGEVRTVPFKRLRKGESKSCGCQGLPPKEKIIKDKIIPQNTEEEQWKESVSFPNYYISTLGRLFNYSRQYMFEHKRVYKLRTCTISREFVAKDEVYRTFIGDIPKGHIVTEDLILLETTTERANKLKNVYSAMLSRCNNKLHKNYHQYGGRGIKIEESFSTARKFIDWSLSSGFELDKNLSIDRKENDGDYSADNCQWIPIGENCQKTRQSKLSKEVAFEIRYGIYKDTPVAETAEFFNCGIGAIQDVLRGKTWK
jgi:hypothetical protein